MMKKALVLLLLLISFVFARALNVEEECRPQPDDEELLYEYEFTGPEDDDIWMVLHWPDNPDRDYCAKFTIDDDAVIKSFEFWVFFNPGTGYLATWEAALYEHIPGSPGHPSDDPLWEVDVDHTRTDSGYDEGSNDIYLIKLNLDEEDWYEVAEGSVHWFSPIVNVYNPDTQTAAWVLEDEYPSNWYNERGTPDDDWWPGPYRAYLRVYGEWLNTAVVGTSWGAIKAGESK